MIHCRYVRPYTLPCKHQHMLCKQFPINTQMENAYEDLSFYNMDSSFTKVMPFFHLTKTDELVIGLKTTISISYM